MQKVIVGRYRMKNAHFDLSDESSYQDWRAQKLAAYPLQPKIIDIDLDNPQTALKFIKDGCKAHNFAIYRFKNASTQTRQQLHQLAQLSGLVQPHNNLCADDDGLSQLEVTQHKGQHDYIPYTNKRLSWHTDGYYHLPSETIHGMLLHCASPAESGGESIWMDHEVAYILLRDTNPDFIAALTHPQAMTIPANILKGEVIRPARTGTVFSWDAQGQLHMRYSARQRNIEWRDDPMTQAAVKCLQALWDTESIYHLRYTLQAGEGLICNNVLHCRTAFNNSPTQQRLIYRGRYLQRVA